MAAILIVDKDENFRALARSPFLAHGHRVLESSSIESARQMLGSESVDFLILGATLPDGSGLDLVRALRATRHRTPVALVAGRIADVPHDERLRKELEIAFFAARSILPDALYREVRQHLSPASVGDPFKDLRDEYAGLLPGLLAEMKKATKEALASRDPEALRKAQEMAHRIRGTAGSLGFREASAQAAEMEEDVSRQLTRLQRPQEVVATPPEEVAPESIPPSRRASLVLEGMTLLVVDADAATRAMAARLAREHMLGFVPARTPAEALESASLYPPSAAILALAPATTEESCRLARDLRKIPGCSALPVIFVASEDRLELRLAAARAKADLFLAGAISEESFSTIVELLRAKEAPSSKVLIVDDDPRMAEALRLMLQQAHYRASVLTSPERLFEALEQERPEVVLLDARMPRINGFDLCRMIRASVRWRHLLVFFLTASSSLETRLAAFESGGDDWILKPVLQQELLVRIEARQERLRAMNERATRDPLTGLLTRQALLARFSKLVDQSRGTQRPFSLALLDVDHFKSVNDLHGHASGDRVLAGLGQLLLSRLRQGDVSARWGGEEFVILLEGEGIGNAHLVMNRLLKEVRTLAFRSDAGERFHITFSAGLAEYPRDAETLEELVRTADVQLYKAKSEGRNRVLG